MAEYIAVIIIAFVAGHISMVLIMFCCTPKLDPEESCENLCSSDNPWTRQADLDALAGFEREVDKNG